jgi:tetratricopeptide (TPR) repeat protein
MADAFMRLKWFDKAIEVLEKHIEIAQPEDIIFEAIGHCWEKKKLFQKARYYYRQASLLNPKDASIFFKIGETYTREHQWEKAAKAFAVALHLDNNNAQYNMAIGNCLMHMNIPNEAVICYLNAVRIKPNIKTTWVALIKSLYISKLFEDALLQLEIAKDHCGAKPEFYYLQAACLFAIGKSKDALKKLESGLKSAPQKVGSFIALDADLIRRNKVSELIAAYKRKK